MADYDLTKHPYGHGNYNVTKQYAGQVVTLIHYIDCATTGALPTTGLTSGKTYKIFGVPEHWWTRCCTMVVHTGEGADEHITVSDGTNSLLTSGDIQTDATVESQVSTTGYYLAGTAGSMSDIYISSDATSTVAKFWIIIEGMYLTTDM
jgi:hypothetical protein